MHPFYKDVEEKIEEYGFMVVGVSGDNQGPGFSYTIGLTEKVGYELIVFGLPPHFAHPMFTDVLNHYINKDIELPRNTPVTKLANMPVIFRECGPIAVTYAMQAFNYYERDIRVIQMVLPDKNGRFPEDVDYDKEYMSPRQPLLYTLH